MKFSGCIPVKMHPPQPVSVESTTAPRAVPVGRTCGIAGQKIPHTNIGRNKYRTAAELAG